MTTTNKDQNPNNRPTLLGVSAIRPIERHGMDAVKHFFHDSTDGTFMGRTPKSWVHIIVFYIVYYSFLAAFWSLMLLIFFQTLKKDQPKWQNTNGIIGSSPGMGLRPYQSDENIGSSMIIFNKNSEADTDLVPGYGGWINRTNEFLAEYKKKLPEATSESAEQIKKFDLESLSHCAHDKFGYDKGTPCVFLKLNRIYGQSNDVYNDVNDLPEEMPISLKEKIGQQTNKDQVWVSCRGEHSGDVDGIGEIKYFPDSQGFPESYFPYMNQVGYTSPIVAVQFLSPKMNKLLHIECRAWSKNILYDVTYRLGIVHFELLIIDDEA